MKGTGLMIVLSKDKLGKMKMPSRKSEPMESEYSESMSMEDSEAPSTDLSKLSDDMLLAEVRKRKLSLDESTTPTEEEM